MTLIKQSPMSSDWFGQPRGLTILFMTEMWEKFSFFGMRALLVYYMTGQLTFSQARASLVYGLYTALVYFTPIIGGAITDRWFGRHRAVVMGGAMMAFGHFMMAFDELFYGALAVIALGNGLFLPSLPSQVESLYAADDPRRKSSFNIYYVGVNLGAFLAPLVCGTLGEFYGWHWGFAAAGAGMLAGLVVYVAGRRYLPPDRPRGGAAVCRLQEPGGRKVFPLLIGIGLAVLVFRGAYEQIGNAVAIWAAEGVDRSITASLVIPMTWFQSVNPLVVFLLTPLLVTYWAREAKQGRELSPLRKMAVGAALVGAGYLALAIVSAGASEHSAPASWVWLVFFLVILTTGELYILPTGLGLFARLAPSALATTVIAGWFFAGFGGNLLAGALGSLWGLFAPAEFFALMAAVAVASSLLLMCLDRPVQQLERLPLNHRGVRGVEAA